MLGWWRCQRKQKATEGTFVCRSWIKPKLQLFHCLFGLWASFSSCGNSESDARKNECYFLSWHNVYSYQSWGEFGSVVRRGWPSAWFSGHRPQTSCDASVLEIRSLSGVLLKASMHVGWAFWLCRLQENLSLGRSVLLLCLIKKSIF